MEKKTEAEKNFWNMIATEKYKNSKIMRENKTAGRE